MASTQQKSAVGNWEDTPLKLDVRPYYFDEKADLIGEGGMGGVYRTLDPGLGRELAIKVIGETYKEDRVSVWRFMQEANITSRLEHPNIVPVHNIGQLQDKRLFYTMKLVRGQTLEKKLAACGSGLKERLDGCLNDFERVCQAMAYAHERGVIHRDLKPANVMVGEFGQIQVMDWGLAKRVGSADVAEATPADGGKSTSAGRTRESVPPADLKTQGPLGTLLYAPSEQICTDKIDQVGKPADVFALGALLCEILTGYPPCLESDEYQQLEQLKKTEKELRDSGKQPTAEYAAIRASLNSLASVICGRAMVGDVSPGVKRLNACKTDELLPHLSLIHLAEKCLACEPKERPADAGVVAKQVDEYQKSVRQRAEDEIVQRAERAEAEKREKAEQLARIKAEEAAASETAKREAEEVARQKAEQAAKSDKAKRRFAQLLAGALGVLVVVLLSTGIGGMILYGEKTKALQDIERLSLEQRAKLIDAYIAEGVKRVDADEIENSLAWFAAAYELEGDEASKHDLHRRRLSTHLRSCPRVAYFWNEPCRSASMSPDGKYCILAKDAGTWEVWDISIPTAPEQKWACNQPSAFIFFLPTSEEILAANRDGSCAIYSISSNKKLAEIPNHTSHLLGVDFGNQGRTILTFHAKGVDLWDWSQGKIAHAQLRPHAGLIEIAAFVQPSSSQLLTVQDSTIRVWTAVRENKKLHIFPGSLPTLAVDIASLFGVAAAPWSDAPIVSVLRGSPAFLSDRSIKHDGRVQQVKGSPDGKLLLTVGYDNRLIHVWNLASASVPEKAFSTIRHDLPVTGVDFSFDGKHILISDTQGSHVKNLSGSSESRFDRGVAFRLPNRSNDGRFVLSQSSTGYPRLFDLAGFRPSNESFRLDNPIRFVAFADNDSKLICSTQKLSGDNQHILTNLVFRDQMTSPEKGSVGTRMWSIATRNETPFLNGDLLKAFHPASRKLLIATAEKKMLELEIAEIGHNHRKRLGKCELLNMFCEDGSRIVSARDAHVYIYDSQTGGQVCAPILFPGLIFGLSTNSNGTVISVAIHRGGEATDVCTWNVEQSAQLGNPMRYDSRIASMSLNRRGDQLLIAAGAKAEIRDPKTGDSRGSPMKHDGEVLYAAFSPDDSSVLTAASDSTAKLWDVATGTPIGIPMSHVSQVVYASFSPKNTFVVTTTLDGVARVWDRATGQAVTPPLRHPRDFLLSSGEGTHLPRPTWHAAFSADENWLATGGAGHDCFVWDLRPWEGELSAIAEFVTGGTVAHGQIVPLASEKEVAGWNALRGVDAWRRATDFQVLAYHVDGSRESGLARNNARLRVHLDFLIDKAADLGLQNRRPTMHAARASIKRDNNDYDGALDDCRAALKYEPGNVAFLAARSDVLARQGHVFLSQGQWTSANKAFESAIPHLSKKEDLWRAQYDCGYAYMKRGDKRKAAAAFGQAAIVDPDHSWSQRLAGRMAGECEMWNVARNHLSRASESKGRQISDDCERLFTFLGEKNPEAYKDAIVRCRNEQLQKKGLGNNYVASQVVWQACLSSKYYIRDLSLDCAIDTFKRALLEDPNSAFLNLVGGAVLLRQAERYGNPKLIPQSTVLLKRSIAYGECAQAWFLLAIAQQLDGDDAQAVSSLKMAESKRALIAGYLDKDSQSWVNRIENDVLGAEASARVGNKERLSAKDKK